MGIAEAFLALLAAGGGGAVVAYIAFQYLGKSWLQHQFAKDLELAKSEIAFAAAKRKSLHDKEYEVLPEIWKALIQAKGSLGTSIIQFREMPDLNRMSEEDLGKWLTNMDLAESEKDLLKSSPADRRLDIFNKILDRRDILKADEHFREFLKRLQEDGIFIEPEIREKLDEVRDALRKSWASRKTDFDTSDMRTEKDFKMESIDIFRKQVEPKINEVEKLIQKRLFPE